jgi:hypothetical protein
VGTTTVHIAPNDGRALPGARRGVTDPAQEYHAHVITGDNPEHTVAEAAGAAAEETVEAIDAAAQENRDPVVAKALDDAAMKADKTVSRVGWLRALVHRLVPAAGRADDDTASSAS